MNLNFSYYIHKSKQKIHEITKYLHNPSTHFQNALEKGIEWRTAFKGFLENASIPYNESLF
jgi:hypothetical protein